MLTRAISAVRFPVDLWEASQTESKSPVMANRSGNAEFGTFLAFVSAQMVAFTDRNLRTDIMKKQRKEKEPGTLVTLRLWTYDGAVQAAPYIRSLVGSLRDGWLDLRQAQEQVRRLEARPGKPDRETLIRLEDSNRDCRHAEAKLEDIMNEMLPLSIFAVDPVAGLVVIPFMRGDALAWFVFDLFDSQGVVAWRLYSDALETRRPLAELEEIQPAAPASNIEVPKP
jgi:hypothetical protein